MRRVGTQLALIVLSIGECSCSLDLEGYHVREGGGGLPDGIGGSGSSPPPNPPNPGDMLDAGVVPPGVGSTGLEGDRGSDGVCVTQGACVSCFRLVGKLPEDVSSSALGLSGDGNVVVGESRDRENITPPYDGRNDDPNVRTRSFRQSWRNEEPRLLDPGGRWPKSSAAVVNRDGSVVVVQGSNQAFRWTADERAFGVLSDRTEPVGVNEDGDVIAANAWSSDYTTVEKAFIWMPGVSTETPLVGVTEVRALSGNGEKVAGTFMAAGYVASIGTAQTPEALVLEGVGEIEAMSADGRVVVGRVTSGPSGTRGFRWVSGSPEAEPLDFVAFDTNEDGSVVVGQGSGGGGCGRGNAVLWRDTGPRFIACDGIVPDSLLPPGLVLEVAYAVSNDGNVVAGDGYVDSPLAPMGWVATVDPSCEGL